MRHARCHRRPIAFDPACDRCPALAANRRQVVPGYGVHPARIAWLGEAPGRLGADRTGVPFTRDRSGRRLQALLIRLGLAAGEDPAAEAPRLSTFVTNLVRCNPPANRTPTTAEVANCHSFLTAELEQVRPDILVTLGLEATRWAAAHLCGRQVERIGALHARPIVVSDRAWPRLLVPSRHPARIATADWARLARVLEQVLAGRA
jgi:DNA polymerase